MSGTRAITLRLDVRDAEVVRQQLALMGEAGERALAKLDAAAQRAAQRSLPAVVQTTEQATGGMRNMGHVIGQAGFQMQDFAVQVQSGTSALTALSQQGSQFLGVFGTGGAIAGAILAVGVLAASFLTGASNADEMKKRTEESFRAMKGFAEEVRDVLSEINNLFLTGAERSAAAANAMRDELVQRTRNVLSAAINMNEGNVIDLDVARAATARAQRQLDEYNRANPPELEERLRRAGVATPANERRSIEERLLEAQNRQRLIEGDIDRQNNRIGQLNDALRQAENSGRVGVDPVDQPPIPPELLRRFREEQRRDRGFLPRGRRRGSGTARDPELDEVTRIIREQNREYDQLQFRTEAVGKSAQDLTANIDGLGNSVSRAGSAWDDFFGKAASAFENAVSSGKSFSDILKALEQDIARLILRATVFQPLGEALSGAGGVASKFFQGLFSSGNGGVKADTAGGAAGPTFTPEVGGVLPNALGNAFSGGQVVPFALGGVVSGGGVVSSPTLAPMALMGEAEPEAIMPLKRDARGRLGVSGGGAITYAPTYTIDARGADAGVDARIRAAMLVAEERAKAGVLAAITRGDPAYRRAMR